MPAIESRSTAAPTRPTLSFSHTASANVGASVSAVDVLSLASADGDVALLKAQLDSAEGQVTTAAAQLESNVRDIGHNTKERIKKIRKRIAAERSAKRWGFLGKIFKAIAVAASAVASVFTGGAGAVAAGLLIASMVVAEAAKNTVGKIISTVLAVASAVVSLGAGTVNAVGSIAAGVTRAAKVTSSAATLASGVTSVAQGVAQKGNLDARARLAELQLLMTRLQSSDQEQVEEMRRGLDRKDRAVEQSGQLLEKRHNAAMPSL